LFAGERHGNTADAITGSINHAPADLYRVARLVVVEHAIVIAVDRIATTLAFRYTSESQFGARSYDGKKLLQSQRGFGAAIGLEDSISQLQKSARRSGVNSTHDEIATRRRRKTATEIGTG